MIRRNRSLRFGFLALLTGSQNFAAAWAPPKPLVPQTNVPHRPPIALIYGHHTALNMVATKEEDKAKPEEITEKYGLEAGLATSLGEKDGGESAKSLLKKYGIAYLATSIPLAIVSFVICYALVDGGVDVAGLLSRVGIEANAAGEKAGTFAIAYAAHKAASPIRFPPTVVLTPLVAQLIGKEPDKEDKESEGLS
jgi:hypothetical protein